MNKVGERSGKILNINVAPPEAYVHVNLYAHMHNTHADVNTDRHYTEIQQNE